MIDFIPLWVVFFLVLAGALAAFEIGFFAGRRRRASGAHEDEGPVNAMVSSTLALLAFILAFTFSIALSRYDARRLLVVDEANTIGTTYLRTEFIREPYKSEIKRILKEYTEVRINGVVRHDLLKDAVARSEKLQDRLWEQTVAVGKESSGSPVTALFIDSVNELIDLHSKRITAGLLARVPETVWAILLIVAEASMCGMGFYCGLTARRREIMVSLLLLSFSTVILLVVDLDRPWEGAIRVSQKPLSDLYQKMSNDSQARRSP